MTNDLQETSETIAPEVSQERVPSQDIEALQQLLAEEKAKAEKYLDNWKRAQADFINYKRRMDEERAQQTKFINSTLILNLLPILDDLERALNSAALNPTDSTTLVEGACLIHRNLLTILEAQGLSALEAVGQPFDPNLHEAIMYAEGEEGKVIEEWRKGYRLHNRVIRPAMVIVGKRGGETSTETDVAVEQSQ